MYQETRDMVVSSTPKGRIRRFLNSLALKPVRTAKSLHCCQLCACAIAKGQEFRDGGVGRRAHEFCFQAVNKEVK